MQVKTDKVQLSVVHSSITVGDVAAKIVPSVKLNEAMARVTFKEASSLVDTSKIYVQQADDVRVFSKFATVTPSLYTVLSSILPVLTMEAITADGGMSLVIGIYEVHKKGGRGQCWEVLENRNEIWLTNNRGMAGDE